MGSEKSGRRDLNPRIWGPRVWYSLHAIAEGAPSSPSPSEKRSLDALLDALPDIIPCGACRGHLREKYELGLRPSASSREELRRGLWELHNAVNADLGKKAFPWEALGGQPSLGDEKDWTVAVAYAAVVVLGVALVSVALSARRASRCAAARRSSPPLDPKRLLARVATA